MGMWKKIVESYYQCAQCRPEYELCEGCVVLLKDLATELVINDRNDRNDRTPALVIDDATDEEEPFEDEPHQPPAIFCVSCLLPGHQGGRECRWPQYKCQNCGHEHAWKILCMEVEFTLKYGGNPLNLAPKKKTEDTSMEELCSDCLDLRHHSRMPCEKKEPP